MSENLEMVCDYLSKNNIAYSSGESIIETEILANVSALGQNIPFKVIIGDGPLGIMFIILMVSLNKDINYGDQFKMMKLINEKNSTLTSGYYLLSDNLTVCYHIQLQKYSINYMSIDLCFACLKASTGFINDVKEVLRLK